MQDQNPFPTDPTNQGDPSTGNNPAPQTEPEDNTPAGFKLGTLLPPVLKVKIPAHSLQFDESKFLRLLAGSISLSRDEKKRIIESIPKLKQSQVDELIRIFEEESYKFSQLSAKHVPQLEKLAKQHANDWIDLEALYQAENKKAADDAAADDIRKSLGL